MWNITVDFETYYDNKYKLKNGKQDGMTTEEYINDERFQVIGVAVKVDEMLPVWHTGTMAEIKSQLLQYDWKNHICLAHNTRFDGAILKWKFGIEAQGYMDTMAMGKALIGSHTSVTLRNMALVFGVGNKGNAVYDALGKRRLDFSKAEMDAYASYCKNDVELTHNLYTKILNKYCFPADEMYLINLTLQMYINPKLKIDTARYEYELNNLKQKKSSMVAAAGTTEEVLRSPKKFGELLSRYGIEPLDSYARNNKEFTDLKNNENDVVRNLVEARLNVMSSLQEKRIERYKGIGQRMDGYLPIPLNYYGAITGRWSGSDKTNLQNLPRNDKGLKKGLVAPSGHIIIEADSSQIEARVLAWWSGQNDVLQQFIDKEDPYKHMASKIYKKPVEEITPDERFIGKQTVLGCGYGMGYKVFKLILEQQGTTISFDEAADIIKIYRQSNSDIVKTWKQCDELLFSLVELDTPIAIGKEGVVDSYVNGIRLPNGLYINYFNLRKASFEDGYEYTGRRQGKIEQINIYGGKVVENIVQALARIIIGFQMANISKDYKVVSTVHDSIVCVVPAADEEEAISSIRKNMCLAPEWAKGLPLDCEVKVGINYGELNAAA